MSKGIIYPIETPSCNSNMVVKALEPPSICILKNVRIDDDYMPETKTFCKYKNIMQS